VHYRCSAHSGAIHEEDEVDSVTAIISALTAGAAAGLKGVGSRLVQDAYARLAGLLRGQLANLDDLQEAPDDAEHTATAAKELRERGLGGDPHVLRAAHTLTAAIQREATADPASWDIAIEQIRAANSVLIKQLDAPEGGIAVRHVEALQGDVRIEGVRAGGRRKN
jgi:hypothetical protein